MKEKFTFIDLFCGIGGIRIGMEKAGGRCVFSSDLNKYAQETYENNFGEIPEGDITKINEKDIPSFDVLCAGFPCQPFSISGKQKGFDDVRGTLFFDICRIVKYHQPKVLFLENVKHIIHHDKGNTLKIILQNIKDLGYFVEYKILNARDFGVPQNRERIIIIASKNKGFNFDKVKIQQPVYLESILENNTKENFLDKKDYTLIPKDKINIKDSGLIFIGYRNKNIWKKGIRENTEHLSRVHRQPNRIYSSSGIHPTIPSQETSGRFFIYIPKIDEVRKLTIKECYRLMGFPETYKINKTITEAYKQIGNSVCIPMIKELAIEIEEQLLKESNNA
ncbi:MAG: DNA cytosine methyltransferase [Alphaproteobacteria bacterium]|jgi:DNA (cytosine-5)-methyltransferase 1|nr:DNA cytosine methyltransferase [Alphaproteobacteria bacterium]